jgi:hypothetical protein
MMRFAMLASASAIALAFTIGSVSAAGQFTTLKGLKAVPMSTAELAAVKGMDHHFFVLVSADHPNATPATIDGQAVFTLDPATNQTSGPLATAGRMSTDWKKDDVPGSKGDNFVTFPGTTTLVSPGYLGLRNACGNGTIQGPGFLC